MRTKVVSFCKLSHSFVSHFVWITSFLCQAGASSLWASCCGLMNEVMGTGAVRGQQPVFGAGAGPFRFAPSAGYSTYPPAASGTTGLVCKACGQAFSVFRRKVGTWSSVWQEKGDYWIGLVEFWVISFQGMSGVLEKFVMGWEWRHFIPLQNDYRI